MEVKLGKRKVEALPGEEQRAGGHWTAHPPDQVQVSCELDPWPDLEWRTLWARQDYPADLDEPSFSFQPFALFAAREADLDRAWESLKARVDATNRAYAEEVIPAREADQRKREEDEDARRRRMKELQARVDELD